MTELWSVVHAERQALIRDLADLPARRWATASLCPGWDVHDVLAHLVDDARTTRLGFLRRLAAAGFDFDRCNARGIARERRADPRDTLDAFRAVSGRTTSAPAAPATRLVEVFVHGEDIRRPLSLTHGYPTGPVTEALRYQLRTGGKLGGGRERAAGLRLVATDADFGADLGADLGAGTVPEVRGSVLALLLAVSGRRVGPEELTGPGAAALVG